MVWRGRVHLEIYKLSANSMHSATIPNCDNNDNKHDVDHNSSNDDDNNVILFKIDQLDIVVAILYLRRSHEHPYNIMEYTKFIHFIYR